MSQIDGLHYMLHTVSTIVVIVVIIVLYMAGSEQCHPSPGLHESVIGGLMRAHRRLGGSSSAGDNTKRLAILAHILILVDGGSSTGSGSSSSSGGSEEGVGKDLLERGPLGRMKMKHGDNQIHGLRGEASFRLY